MQAVLLEHAGQQNKICFHQHAGLGVLRLPVDGQLLVDLLQIAVDFIGVFKQDFSVFVQVDSLVSPVEERAAQLCLNGLDGFAQGRLGQAQLVGRSGDMLELCDLFKILQLLQLNHNIHQYPNFCKTPR